MGNENYRLTPFKATYDNVVRNPIRAITKKISGRELEPTALIHLPLVLALSVFMYVQADAVYTRALENRINSQVSSNALQFDQAIQSDFRYNRIKKALEDSKITAKEAHREAYLVSLAYTQYYKYRDSNPESRSLQSEMELIDHYLFAHLKTVIKEGVKPVAGFFVPDLSKGPISEKQTMELFAVNHLLYLKYQVIAEGASFFLVEN